MAVVSAIALAGRFAKHGNHRLPFRKDEVPARDLITRVTMQVINEAKTDSRKDQESKSYVAYYQNNTQPMMNFVAALKDDLFLVLGAPSFDELEDAGTGSFFDISSSVMKQKPKTHQQNDSES